MMLGARTAAWAKSGGAPSSEYGGLKFTAEAADSSVQLTAVGSAPAVTLVKSFDGVNWSDYVVGDVISLPRVGDYVYLAAGEGGNYKFANSLTAYHKFVMTGIIAATGDITSLRSFDLEQTDLASFSYAYMFSGCTSLKSAPELPADKVNQACYYSMFSGCTSLTSAPELPAASLVRSSVTSMFSGCTSLSYLKVHFTSWVATTDWVKDVAGSGVFYKPTALPEEYGTSKIPTGWTVINID